MIDPISCVTLAAGAFKTLKSAVAAGRDLQDCTSQLASWGRAMSCLLYTSDAADDL